ncbi:MAG TPA: VTT domain-containing protein [Candidatus Paceibacterota bacterium]|nr:VTT domain-containing protein [Candidatus Paceibacterota bacterium]
MFDIPSLIAAAGVLGVAAVIFAETGLLIGFLLPGDSLLFPAGFLASQGHLNIWALIGATTVAAILGDSLAYWIGKKTGPALFDREDSLLFKKHYVKKTHDYFEKYGAKTVVIARFIPIVRTFAPVVAGIGEMRYRTFLIYNVVGGALWAAGLSLLGFFLGAWIPDIDHYLLPIVALIIVLSALPPIIHILKEKENREALKRAWQRLTKK